MHPQYIHFLAETGGYNIDEVAGDLWGSGRQQVALLGLMKMTQSCYDQTFVSDQSDHPSTMGSEVSSDQ